MLKIEIPNEVSMIIEALQDSGYEAYIVGGCVRDSVLGKTPKDWDICTSALPDEIKKCMPYKTVDTGIKHGTITVVIDSVGYEVTTYRKDGDYSDSRHPDSVEFVTSLTEDLARRDFTINAMAYNKSEGLVDMFGGMFDISRKKITCVGVPDERFSEDALRILRAMRFASTYGFSINPTTADAMHRHRERLNNISSERIQMELKRMLMGDGVLPILLEFSDIVASIIPELEPCVGFDQNNRYHQYSVYDHIAHAVSNDRSGNESVRLALLLHDIAKPRCYTEDERGGHFYGHEISGRAIAEQIMNRLRFENRTKSEVLDLILYHDTHIDTTEKAVKRWLNKLGEPVFRKLLFVKMADTEAHKKGTYEPYLERCYQIRSIMEKIIAEEQCFSIKDLAINGNDIKDIGVPQGVMIGKILRNILDKVMSSELANDAEVLRNYATMLKQHIKYTRE